MLLLRRDGRWKTLLEAVRDLAEKPVDAEAEQHIFERIKAPSRRGDFKAQLYEYLESYTKDAAHNMVTAAGAAGVLETWRRLCEHGRSLRERNLRAEHRRVYHPKQVTLDEVQKAIVRWKRSCSSTRRRRTTS